MMHIMKSTATILSCIALLLYTAGAGAAANVKDPNGAWPRPAATNARSPDPELSEAKSQLVKCLDKAPNNVVNTNSGKFVAYCLRQLGW